MRTIAMAFLIIFASLFLVVPVFGEEEGEGDGEDKGLEMQNEVTDSVNEYIENDFSHIRISEVLPSPSESEFVELIHLGDNPINISGWRLESEGISQKEKTLEGTIENFLLFKKPITLYDEDGVVRLYAPVESSGDNSDSWKLVDEMQYRDVKKGFSFSRNFETGKDEWVCNPTPGEENDFSVCENLEMYNPKTVRFSEVLADPGEWGEEFVEIYNYGEERVNLSDWGIYDGKNEESEDNKKKLKSLGSGFLEKEDFATFKMSLHNSGKHLVLKNSLGEIIDEFEYDKSTKGKSWAFDGEKWRETPDVTKDEKNAFPKSQKGATIRINEVLANPEGDEEAGEYIELWNYGDEDISIEYWELADATNKPFIFPRDTQLGAGEIHVIYRKDFRFALNNGKETVFLRDASGNEIDTAVFETAKEGISWNWNEKEKKWRASKHRTPGQENRFNNLPIIQEFDVPKEVYDGVKAEFFVKAKDGDGDDLSFRWDFGNGRKSYKPETTHIYRDQDMRYTVTLRVSDGIEEIFREQKLQVKQFPRRKVNIVAFVPNPVGKDSENEWIDIRNNDKKKVDLFGWSIATGKDRKSLVNHPIRKNIVLKEGELKRITRKDSAFSLRNTFGVVELRRPDGSVADWVSYSKEKITENELYAINDHGEWKWSGGQSVAYTNEEEVVLEKIDSEYVESLVLGVMSEDDPFVHPALFLFKDEVLWQRLTFSVRKVEQIGERFLFTRTGIVSDPKGFRGRCIVGQCRGA